MRHVARYGRDACFMIRGERYYRSMLTVVQGNHWPTLADELAARLPPDDPFAPAILLVPSHVVGRRIVQHLAIRRGIVAGLVPQTLIEYGARCIREDGCQPIGPLALRSALASALAVPTECPDALHHYLEGPRPDVRRVQLAARLADQYAEYALGRPHWLDAWAEDKAAPGELDRALEAWQRALFASAMRRLGKADRPARLASLGPARPRTGPPLFVFGISELQPVHLRLLHRWSTVREVTVLALSPCAEYWEDARSDERLLGGWAKPVQIAVSELTTLTEGNVEHAFVLRHGTALDEVITDLAMRQVRTVASESAGIGVLACPSQRRELDEVCADIVRFVSNGGDASDVLLAVAGPDPAAYLAQLQSVLESMVAPTSDGRPGLPVRVIGATVRGLGRVGELVLALLALPTGGAARSTMLRVMKHPLLLARFPTIDATVWEQWINDAGIFFGADARAFDATYLQGETRFHWEQGLTRIALGAFLDGMEPVSFGATQLQPLSWHEDKTQAAAACVAVARSLLHDAAILRTTVAPMRSWAQQLGRYIRYYVSTAADEAAARDLACVLEMIGELGEACSDDRALDFDEVRARIEAELPRLRVDDGVRQGLWAGPLAAMRGLPARRAYVVGLSELRFPARSRPWAFDARTLGRRDITARDRDLQAMLDVMLATSDSLTLSYVCRDETNGEEIAVASVVRDLFDAVGPHWGGDAALTQATRTIDMSPWLSHPGPERAAVDARNELRLFTGQSGERALVADEIRALATSSGVAKEPTFRELTISQLRAFLDSPMQGWGRAVANMREQADVIVPDAEPTELLRPAEAVLLRGALFHLLATQSILVDEAYDTALAALNAPYPAGPFASATREKHLRLLSDWLSTLGVRGAFHQDRIAADQPVNLSVTTPSGVAVTVHLTGNLGQRIVPHGLLCVTASQAPHKQRHRAALHHVVRAVMGHPQQTTPYLLLGNEKHERGTMLPWTTDAARAYLEGLVTDLLWGTNTYVLPPDKAAKWAAEPADDLRIDDDDIGFGPLKRSGRLRVPPDMHAIIQRRWEPLWERWHQEKHRPGTNDA